MTAPAQPDLRKPARWCQNSASETRCPPSALSVPPPAVKACELPRPPCPFPTLPTPHPGHIQSLPHFLVALSPGTPPSWHPAPQAAGFAHRLTGLGCMRQSPRTCSSTWRRPHSPPPWEGTGLEATPAPKEGQTKGNKPKNGGEPSGLEKEGRGSQGNGVHLMNASGLENGNGRGRPKEAMRGMEGQSGGRKSSHAAWDKSFCCFIRFSVNQLVFARTGYAGEC